MIRRLDPPRDDEIADALRLYDQMWSIERIAKTLRSRIRNGEYQPRRRIPSQSEMCGEFQSAGTASPVLCMSEHDRHEGVYVVEADAAVGRAGGGVEVVHVQRHRRGDGAQGLVHHGGHAVHGVAAAA